MTDPSHKPDVNAIFFTFELEMEDNLSRDGVCNDIENERGKFLFHRNTEDILFCNMFFFHSTH